MPLVHRPSNAIGLLIVTVLLGKSAGRMTPGLATGAPGEAVAPAPEQQTGLNLLFIQPAKSGSLVLQSNNNQSGVLVLKDVSKFTIWFTDTPARKAGQAETSLFVGSNFTDDNGDWLSKPNAALYISKPGPGAADDIVVIVTLSNPVYNDTAMTLTYKASVIPGNSTLLESRPTKRQSELLKSYLAIAGGAPAPTLLSKVENGSLVFDHAVLFIDCWWWGGGWGGWGWGGWGWGGWGR
eukprot:jgi/Botrbrau1/22522/Bobra.114_2s0047.1